MTEVEELLYYTPALIVVGSWFIGLWYMGRCHDKMLRKSLTVNRRS